MRMQNAESLTEEQIQQFLTGSETIEFRGQNRAELYGWVERVLVAQEYATRSKKQRGAVRAYIVKLIFYTMSAEVIHSRLVAISKTA